MWKYLKTPAIFPNRESPEVTQADVPATNSDSSDEIIDLQGDQLKELQNTGGLRLSSWDLLALGLASAFGGHFYLWSTASLAGFGGLVVSTFLVFTGYAMLMLCMAELASALPFAGGSYGVARVTLGSYVGFLVACFDAFQSIFNAFFAVWVLTHVLQLLWDSKPKYLPAWWVLTHLSYILAHAWGGRTYWVILKILTYGSLCLMLIYILGCAKIADFDKNARMPAADDDIESVWFLGGAKLFFQILPFPCIFFVGNESLNLAAHETKNPKVDIPWAYFTSFTTNSLLTFALIFVASSVFYGTLLLPRLTPAPLSWGYMFLFDIDIYKALALSVVPMYTAGFGFTYHYAYQIRAMGKSGLVNSWLGYDYPYINTPVNALLFGAAIAFLIGCRYLYLDPLEHENLFYINLLGAVCVYFTQFISFIVFRWYYPTIKREFTSPLGIFGALYGIIFFLIVFISLAALEASPAIIAFAVYLVLLTIYYVLVVRHREKFSEEEKTVMFKAYLMKTNRQRQERIRQGKARPLTVLQAVFAGFLSFFESPAPAVAKQVQSLASDSNSASITQRTLRIKPGQRVLDYAAKTSSQKGNVEKQGSTVRLYGAGISTKSVPQVASISEDSPVPERGLELPPLVNNGDPIISDNTNARISALNPLPPIATNHSDAASDALIRDSELNTDLEANIPCASVESEDRAGTSKNGADNVESPEHSNQTPQNKLV